MTVLKTVFEERWEDITSLFSVERWSSTLENVKTAFQTKWSEIVEWWQGTALYTWWEENVSPWFTQEKWTELFNNIWLALQTKWSELVTWWQETALYTWWEENVAPWFTLEKWLELYATIKDAIVEKWNELVAWWKTNIQSWWDNNVKPWFTIEKWRELGENMKEGLFSGFKGLVNKVVDILNEVISSVESMVNNAIEGINSLLNMIIKKRCAEIIGGGNGMKIPGKMQIQILHGNHLCIAAAGRTALDAKAGPKGRLSEGDDRLFPELSERLSQADAGGGLSLSRRSGIDRRNQNQLSVRAVLDGRHEFLGKLRLVLSVKLQIIRTDFQLLRHPFNRLHDCFLRDFNICFHL